MGVIGGNLCKKFFLWSKQYDVLKHKKGVICSASSRKSPVDSSSRQLSLAPTNSSEKSQVEPTVIRIVIESKSLVCLPIISTHWSFSLSTSVISAMLSKAPWFLTRVVRMMCQHPLLLQATGREHQDSSWLKWDKKCNEEWHHLRHNSGLDPRSYTSE